jgi:hypothetical protein
MSDFKDPFSRPRKLTSEVELSVELIDRYLLGEKLRIKAESLLGGNSLVRLVKDGTQLSCVFIEPRGPVFTSLNVKSYSLESLCTCSAQGPCAHGGALAIAYLADPERFLDLTVYLKNLEQKDHGELLDTLRTVLSNFPAALDFLNPPGFDGLLGQDLDDFWSLDDDEPWDVSEDEEDYLPDLVEVDDDPPDPDQIN